MKYTKPLSEPFSWADVAIFAEEMELALRPLSPHPKYKDAYQKVVLFRQRIKELDTFFYLVCETPKDDLMQTVTTRCVTLASAKQIASECKGYWTIYRQKADGTRRVVARNK